MVYIYIYVHTLISPEPQTLWCCDENGGEMANAPTMWKENNNISIKSTIKRG